MVNQKINNMCIVCRWTTCFTTILYDEIICDENIKRKFLDFDMEIIIPVIRNSFHKWYDNYKDKLIVNKESINNINSNFITDFIKQLIIVKESSSSEGVIKFINAHSGSIALEFLKSKFFKEIIDILKE
jgi:hypothetical protein